MRLVNYQPFGHFVPGDELDVPDGDVFDTYYWHVQSDEVEPPAIPAEQESE